nr:hypothetical protein [uncultured Cohaesibacter sp.]
MPIAIGAISAFFSGIATAAGFGALNLAALTAGGLTASAYGAGLALGGLVASLGGIGTLLSVAAVGVGLFSQPDLPRGIQPSSQTQIVRTSVGYRRKGYGTLRSGGHLLFQGVKKGTELFAEGGNNMTMVLAVMDGKMHAFKAFYIDGQEVSVDENLLATSDKYAGKVAFDVRHGADDQTAFPDLLEDFGDQIDEDWRGLGVSMLLVRFLCKSDVYNMIPSGAYTEPNALLETSELLDPRTGQVVYSANSAMVIRDHLISPTIQNGMEVPEEFIDDDDDEFGWSLMADIADVQVAGPEGTTRPQWETHGWVDYSDTPVATLRHMLASCDAKLMLTKNGKIGLSLGGVWRKPTMLLTDDDIFSIERTEGDFRQDQGTVIKSQYLSPAHGYVEQDAKEYVHPNAATLGRSVKPLNFIMAANHGQCRHLQKIAASRINTKMKIQVQTVEYIKDLKNQRLVQIQSGEGGNAIEGSFEIQDEVKEVFDEQGFCIGQAFVAIMQSQEDISYDELIEGVPPPEVQPDPNNDLTPDAPTLAVTVNGLIATCEISDTSENYTHTIRYREVLGGGDFGNYAYANLEPGLFVIDIGLTDGKTYEFEAKAATISQLSSPYGPGTPLVRSVTQDPTPPANCQNVDAVTGPSAGEVDVTFLTPSSVNFSVANIYVGVSSDPAEATWKGAVSGANTSHTERVANLSAGSVYVFVSSANASGKESDRLAAASNPVNVT